MMEAANLGAYLCRRSETEFADALKALSAFPNYTKNPKGYVNAALTVREKYADSGQSLAIPTWAYSAEARVELAACRFAKLSRIQRR
jgi:hypothetical protein